jgi:hypothetical protein
MRFQVRTLQVPRRGAGAFLPGWVRTPTAATNGNNLVYGCPGTMAIPSPRPAALVDFQLGGQWNQPSSCAPDFFYPSIYYAKMNRGLTFPGRILSDNVLPVPAGTHSGVPSQTQYRVRIGGRTATSAFRPFTQWPTYAGAQQ